MSISYALSQIFIIINYIFLIISYQSKKRKHILFFNLIGIISTGISFMLLSAYSGLAMTFVALIRNIIFIIDEKKNKKTNTNSLKDYVILAIIFTICIIAGMLTYNGILSMTAVIATMLYTYSIWQKNTKGYKILGIPIGILSVIYYIYVFSIFGIILESISTVSSIIGYIREANHKHIRLEEGKKMECKIENAKQYVELLNKYGSPLYVYNYDILKERCEEMRQFKEELEGKLNGIKVRMHYSPKANTNPAILKVVKESGLSVDSMSPFELDICQKCGFENDDILYVCNNIDKQEMKMINEKRYFDLS